MLKYIFAFLIPLQFTFAQDSLTVKDETDAIDDYWQKELTPITDLNEIVSYIHNDPLNGFFCENIPAGNPLVREIAINSWFGARNHPIHGVVKFHRGIDLKGQQGEQVIASGNGVVLAAGFKEDLGNFIKIRHKYGFESIYGHLSAINVKQGVTVKKGQHIGKVGATGKVTGPHLHYTLKKNQTYLDPFDFIFMSFDKNM